MPVRIQKNSTVLMHFTLQLADGSTAESTRAQGKRILLRLGNNSLSAALEQQLLGLQVGDKYHFTLSEETAFGMANPDLIHSFSPCDFAQTGIPDTVNIMLFTAMDGGEMPDIVRAVAEGSITVDFNHPLAGQALSFAIDVLEIDPKQKTSHANITG